MQQQQLLNQARNARSKESSGMRSSGFLLEELYALRHPAHSRYPERSAYDFHCGNAEIDVKGCWADQYNGVVFIEHTQNTDNGSQPAYMKDKSGKNIFLAYIDYETGDEHTIFWNKLYAELKDKRLGTGGFGALGWLVRLSDYPKLIKTVRYT